MADQLAPLLVQAVLHLNRGGEALHKQIYLQVREAILSGKLLANSPMPSTRDLAETLGVARSTVVDAFDQLKAEGYLESRQGAPTRIAALSPRHLGAYRVEDPSHHITARTSQVRPCHWRNDDPPTPITLRAFRPGVPDLKAFPAKEWAAHLTRRARQPAAHDLSYVGYNGVASLRNEILSHVLQTRYVRATADQVLVLPSAQAAFDVVARCCLSPGAAAWVEDPGYPGIQGVLRGHQARIIPVPVDAEGMQPKGIRSRPRLIYLTPSHQYPTGVAMSLKRRLSILELARRCEANIIEDDYDSEFQYRGMPLASLQGLDGSACVHYVGTFSKSLAPGLHVAYLIVPPQYVEAAHTIATTSGFTVPIHVQLALADFMRDGALRRHIRKMTAVYADRMRALVAALNRRGSGRFTVPEAVGGLQLCVEWVGTEDHLLVGALRDAGIASVALSSACNAQRRNGLLLGIGLVDEAEIEPSVDILCSIAELHR